MFTHHSIIFRLLHAPALNNRLGERERVHDQLQHSAPFLPNLNHCASLTDCHHCCMLYHTSDKHWSRPRKCHAVFGHCGPLRWVFLCPEDGLMHPYFSRSDAPDTYPGLTSKWNKPPSISPGAQADWDLRQHPAATWQHALRIGTHLSLRASFRSLVETMYFHVCVESSFAWSLLKCFVTGTPQPATSSLLSSSTFRSATKSHIQFSGKRRDRMQTLRGPA